MCKKLLFLRTASTIGFNYICTERRGYLEQDKIINLAEANQSLTIKNEAYC